MIKWGLPQECKIDLTFEKSTNVIYQNYSSIRKEKLYEYLNRCRRSIWQNSYAFLIKQNKKATKQEKASLHTRNEGNFSQPDKNLHLQLLTINFILNRGWLDASPWTRNRARISVFISSTPTNTKTQTSAIKQ